MNIGTEFARKYTNAPTFITDQELPMITDAGQISNAKTYRIWGLSQEFGALHILDKLKELALSDEARLFVKMLIDKSLPYDSKKSDKPKREVLKMQKQCYRLILTVFPMGFSLPKYFLANFSERIIE